MFVNGQVNEYSLGSLQYVDEEALMDDLKLMCSNAKVYNREDSDVHRDAIVFEEVVKKATKTMNVCCPLEAAELSGGHSPVRRSTSSTRRSHQSFRAPTTALQGTLMQLYDYVLQYSTGQADSQRYLATHFQTLPLKTVSHHPPVAILTLCKIIKSKE